MKKIFIFIFSVSCLLTKAEVWTYSDCVEYAREHNITLQKSLLNELNSEYTLEEAKAQWQPSLNFSTTHGYTNMPWGTGNRNAYNSNYGLNAGWTLWNGNIRENTIKQDKILLEISRINSNVLWQNIETEILQAYINILYSKEAILIYEEAVKVSGAQEERAKILLESGKISKVDYAQLKTQYEQDKYALVNARSTYESRRLDLKQLLQLGIESSIIVQDIDWSSSEVLSALPEMSESYDLALNKDLELQGLNLSQEASELQIAIAKGNRLPNISLNAGVGTGYFAPADTGFGNSLKQSWSENIGLTFSIPIFDNARTKTAIAQAKVAQLDADLNIEQRKSDLGQMIESWYIETQSSQSRYSAALSQLEAAELSQTLTNERFNLGYVDVIELMTAHNDYINASQTLLQAKFMAMLGKKMIEYYRTYTITLP